MIKTESWQTRKDTVMSLTTNGLFRLDRLFNISDFCNDRNLDEETVVEMLSFHFKGYIDSLSSSAYFGANCSVGAVLITTLPGITISETEVTTDLESLHDYLKTVVPGDFLWKHLGLQVFPTERAVDNSVISEMYKLIFTFKPAKQSFLKRSMLGFTTDEHLPSDDRKNAYICIYIWRDTTASTALTAGIVGRYNIQYREISAPKKFTI